MHQENTTGQIKAYTTYYQLSQSIFGNKEISPSIKTITESSLIYGVERVKQFI